MGPLRESPALLSPLRSSNLQLPPFHIRFGVAISSILLSVRIAPLGGRDHIDTVATLADPNELFLPGDRQNNLAMSSVPLLRPPVPGNRSNAGSPRAPKLTLGIPPSPNAKPVNGNGASDAPQPLSLSQPPTQAQPQPLQPQPLQATRPTPPRLQLATPMGSSQNLSQQTTIKPAGRPSLGLATNGLGVNGQTGSHGKGSDPASANSQYSTLNFAMGLRQPGNGNSDPSSAIGSVYSDRESGSQLEGENGVNGLLPDLDKLSLEKGRPLDVEDLDDEGWHAASEQKKIDELGSLGEGAGGAVTRCKLKDGKTVFALKVSLYCELYVWHVDES